MLWLLGCLEFKTDGISDIIKALSLQVDCWMHLVQYSILRLLALLKEMEKSQTLVLLLVLRLRSFLLIVVLSCVQSCDLRDRSVDGFCLRWILCPLCSSHSVAAVALAFIVVDCCFYWASVVVASPNSNVLQQRTVHTPSSCFALILRRLLIRLVIYLDPLRFERIKRKLVCWEWMVGKGLPWERREEEWQQPGVTNDDPAGERLCGGRGIDIFFNMSRVGLSTP